MGCCASNEIIDEKSIQKLRDQEIDEQLKKDRERMSNEVKLLLLGNVYVNSKCRYYQSN